MTPKIAKGAVKNLTAPFRHFLNHIATAECRRSTLVQINRQEPKGIKNRGVKLRDLVRSKRYSPGVELEKVIPSHPIDN